MLPEIPATLTPAPAPHTQPSGLSVNALVRWQETASARMYSEYMTGPYSAVDDAGVVMCFPTFGRHEEQSQALRAAGYRWTGRGWAKRIRSDETRVELTWARTLYAALHPTWKNWSRHD